MSSLVNRRAKGARAELKAQRALEAEGYLVARAPPAAIYCHNDLFGCFDLVAINFTRIRMIQVTTGSGVAAKKRLIDSRRSQLPFISGVQYEVWRLVPRKGWRFWVKGGGPDNWMEVECQ